MSLLLMDPVCQLLIAWANVKLFKVKTRPVKAVCSPERLVSPDPGAAETL
jgi:hypothetical protein